MKSSVKKFSSFVIIVMLVVFALAIFATSSFAVKAEGPTSIELPLKLVKKVEFKLDESSALIEQPLAADENFTFKIGETEYTIGRGTHFNIPAGEGKVWQYKALKSGSFANLDTTENNFKKPGIYKSPTITAEDLIEGATVGENGPTITLPEGGTYIEYTIGIKLGTLNAYASDTEKRSFNTKAQGINPAYTFTGAVTTDFDSVTYSPQLGTDVEIYKPEGSETEWKFNGAYLDVVENNFMRSGTYTANVKAKESSYYVTDENSIIQYEIHKADATSFVYNTGGDEKQYYAVGVYGIPLREAYAFNLESTIALKGTWNMIEPAGELDKIIDETIATPGGAISDSVYTFKFTAEEGYENEYYNTANLEQVHIKVLSKPQVRFIKHDGTFTSLQDADIETTEYIAKFKIPDSGITKSGYTFKGWVLDGDETRPYEKTTSPMDFVLQARFIFTQKWEANKDTKFKLKYFFEHISEVDDDGNPVYKEGLGPTAFPNETATGTTDATLKTNEDIETFGFADESKYKLLGFEFNQIKTLADEDNKNFKIKGDGSAEYKLFYTRKTFSFVFEAKEEDAIDPASLPADILDIRFGKKQKLPTDEIAKKGYIFNGYTDGLKKTRTGENQIFKAGEEYNFNETSNEIHDGAKVTFTLNFSARKDVPYVVYHKLLNGTDLKDPEIIKTGTTKEEARAVYALVGYRKAQSPDPLKKDTGTIEVTDLANTLSLEELVASEEILKLYCYYEKITGTYIFDYPGAPEGPAKAVEYGDIITLPKALTSDESRVFLGWQINGGSKYYEAESTFEFRGGDLVFTPAWSYAQGQTEEETFDNSFTYTKEKIKLSGGAIAGIVIASVVVAGIITFSIIWFGVKKKSFKDLIPKKGVRKGKGKGKRKGGFLK